MNDIDTLPDRIRDAMLEYERVGYEIRYANQDDVIYLLSKDNEVLYGVTFDVRKVDTSQIGGSELAEVQLGLKWYGEGEPPEEEASVVKAILDNVFAVNKMN